MSAFQQPLFQPETFEKDKKGASSNILQTSFTGNVYDKVVYEGSEKNMG